MPDKIEGTWPPIVLMLFGTDLLIRPIPQPVEDAIVLVRPDHCGDAVFERGRSLRKSNCVATKRGAFMRIRVAVLTLVVFSFLPDVSRAQDPFGDSRRAFEGELKKYLGLKQIPSNPVITKLHLPYSDLKGKDPSLRVEIMNRWIGHIPGKMVVVDRDEKKIWNDVFSKIDPARRAASPSEVEAIAALNRGSTTFSYSNGGKGYRIEWTIRVLNKSGHVCTSFTIGGESPPDTFAGLPGSSVYGRPPDVDRVIASLNSLPLGHDMVLAELKRLEGKWVVVSAFSKKMTVQVKQNNPSTKVQRAVETVFDKEVGKQFIFDDQTLEIRPMRGAIITMKVQLTPWWETKMIDLAPASGSAAKKLGLYSINGDELRLTLSTASERPMRIDGFDGTVYVLTRMKE